MEMLVSFYNYEDGETLATFAGDMNNYRAYYEFMEDDIPVVFDEETYDILCMDVVPEEDGFHTLRVWVLKNCDCNGECCDCDCENCITCGEDEEDDF